MGAIAIATLLLVGVPHVLSAANVNALATVPVFKTILKMPISDTLLCALIAGGIGSASIIAAVKAKRLSNAEDSNGSHHNPPVPSDAISGRSGSRSLGEPRRLVETTTMTHRTEKGSGILADVSDGELLEAEIVVEVRRLDPVPPEDAKDRSSSERSRGGPSRSHQGPPPPPSGDEVPASDDRISSSTPEANDA